MPALKKYIQKKIEPHIDRIQAIKGIFLFVFLFLLFEFFWKLCIHQSEDDRLLFVLGYDWTAYTDGLCVWTAKTVHWIVSSVMGYSDFRIVGTTLFFDDGFPIHIVWGCTGLKQLFMFSFILCFYFGPRNSKYWFIPSSQAILFIINLLRLSFIALIVKSPFPEWFIPLNEWYNNRSWVNSEESYWLFYTDWFNLFHRDIFTWIYYDGVLFLLWFIWEEKIKKPYQLLRTKDRNTQN